MGFLVSNLLWVFGGKELWETGHSYSLVCHSHVWKRRVPRPSEHPAE